MEKFNFNVLILLLLCLLDTSPKVFSQNYTGKYEYQMSGVYQIFSFVVNQDSTYLYEQRSNTTLMVSEGKWRVKNKTFNLREDILKGFCHKCKGVL